MKIPNWFPLLLALPASGAPTLRMSPETPCVFAGGEVRRTLEFGEPVSGRLAWSVDVLPTRRPLVRREEAVEAARKATLRFEVPPLRSGVAMDLELWASLHVAGGPQTEYRQQLRALPRNAFPDAERKALAEGLHVLDPDGRLIECLTECAVAPTVVRHVPRLVPGVRGTLLVGPDARLNERGLGEALGALAAGGWQVIVLEPGPGYLSLPGATRFSLATDAVVSRMAKRLHPRFGRRTLGLALAAKGGQVVLDTRVAEAPACWTELDYASGGAMILTTLPIVSAWSEEPTPRHLLRAMLLDKSALKHESTEPQSNHDSQ